MCFSSNTGNKYPYSDTCGNNVTVLFAFTSNEAEVPPFSQPFHAHKLKHNSFSNTCNQALRETCNSNHFSFLIKPFRPKTNFEPAYTVRCNKHLIFSSVCKSFRTSDIIVSINVHCSSSCKP